MRSAHRILAGADGPRARALPAGELLHPLPLALVLLLAANDHVLKRSGWLPAALTGKLSDLAGFAFFPVLCTAVLDCCLLAAARLGAAVDFSLRPWKLWASIGFTATLMAAIKLSTPISALVARGLGAVGFPSAIVTDPTDLYTAPALAIAYWLGRRELARVPLGRLEVLERAWRRCGVTPADGLGDVRARAADPAAVDALATGLERFYATGDAGPAEAALARLRR